MKVRIVVGIIGLDQHEVGAIAIARLLTLHGFEVIYLGRFQTPQSMIAAAVDEGAQVVGASCHSWEFISFAPELAALAKQEGVAVVLGGSVITSGDETGGLEGESGQDSGTHGWTGGGHHRSGTWSRTCLRDPSRFPRRTGRCQRS